MNKTVRVVAIVALALAVGAVVMAKRASPPSSASAGDAPATQAAPRTATAAKMPRLLDLGATKCVPCKMMAPILEELKKEYAGKMQVDFIDVWQDEAAGQQYGIERIPTQIFFDASGKELFRHEGFIAKAEILAKWKQLGIEFPGAK